MAILFARHEELLKVVSEIGVRPHFKTRNLIALLASGNVTLKTGRLNS